MTFNELQKIMTAEVALYFQGSQEILVGEEGMDLNAEMTEGEVDGIREAFTALVGDVFEQRI